MNAIQKRCRPKHQVLVLNCYPKTTKGAVDVKPNSSELSYLLFYATSRRSKIQKVGSFLEKKTASDVWRLRIGNVQVTLQILAALIEKSPKDMPLFAPYVLKILDLVLRSDDLTMVESSLPTLATFCENHDASSLQADQAYLNQYETVVQAYATLASTRHSPGKTTPSKPVAMRWRNTGLEAIKCVASSDALSSVSALQLDIMVPMILENLWTDNEDFLNVLLHRATSDEKVDHEKLLLKRRTSIATVGTVEIAGDTNPIALAGTALDVDKLAEEDIGVLAMQCLKQVFVVPNRPQIHGATSALLKFIDERVSQDEVVVKRHPHTGHDYGWAIKILDMVTRWSAVQDRYVILVTIMETMMKTSISDENMRQHLVLAAMAGSLLRSDINLIGLSVMDVLLGFITQIRKIVHLPGGRLDVSDNSSDENDEFGMEAAVSIVSRRKELLGRIEQSIGELATHVYYMDQIGDMISAILLRLRPSPPSGSTSNSSPAGERADGQNGTGSNSNLADSQQLETYFSHNAGKISALRAVKSILLVANPSTKLSGNVSLLRNPVPITVWEGTQWMLRDPDGQVRKAYVDALVTWLDRETTVNDLKAKDDSAPNRNSGLKHGKELTAAAIARRAASSASAREKPSKAPHSYFLQLIHVAIYDNAIQFVDFEGDLLLLHILLTKLTMRLGVNAVRRSLPMVFRLQEDIQDAETPISKVRIGSLCHGYFWTLTETFDFDASVVGRAIHNEIVRRRSKGFWIDGIRVPPPSLDKLLPPGVPKPPPKLPMREIESEALLPFDDRISLVECVATGYQESSTSPPVSPAGSPGRNYANPISTNLSSIPTIEAEQELPSKLREEMMTLDWNREAVFLAIQDGSKSASLNGSRSGTTAFTNRNLLTANGGALNGHSPISPSSPVDSSHRRPATAHEPATVGNQIRKASMQSAASAGQGSSSSRGYVTTVEQLKLILAGGQLAPTNLPSGTTADESSDSMASYEFTPSELSFNPGQGAQGGQGDHGDVGQGKFVRSGTGSTRKASLGESLGPLNSNPPDEVGPVIEGDGEENVPPVPPVPSILSLPQAPAASSNVAAQDHAPNHSRKNLRSRGGEAAPAKYNFSGVQSPALDLQSLLLGLESHAGESTLSSHEKPPY
ncbi:hypothetical protein MKZ38_010155 [Zalerion maritima]|uniref:Protein EFR3 n=1 Tax=Zalerion maritima TaxID=339359 RepID=A0AAD5WVA7_9PEZI|nr:hypothetical protein MKZ38_010155 [Zalerion maritima]